MSFADQPVFKRYRAPRAHLATLADPALCRADDWVQSNRVSLAESGLSVWGQSLDAARQTARREVLEAALHYTLAYRSFSGAKSFDEQTISALSEAPLLVGGHQPELYHPGVWLKNYCLSHVAKRLDGVAINLIVDNDLCHGTSIRVPSVIKKQDGSSSVQVTAIPFDIPDFHGPWECQAVTDSAAWNSFPDRVATQVAGLIDEPLVHSLWKQVTKGTKQGLPIGAAIARGRHLLEGQHGLDTLEVPLSIIAETRSFARFALQLLSDLPQLQASYNNCLQLYRRVHHIRSTAHPVPSLDRQGDWLEAPFWIYHRGNANRQRLFARRSGDDLQLTDRHGWQASICLRDGSESSVDQWLSLAQDGVCIRTRALMTTWYSRMLLSDLFMHGIGGGKYDQLTDLIINDFCQVQAPIFSVISGSVWLPVDLPSVTESDIDHAIYKAREIHFHPEHYIAMPTVEQQSWIARKRDLLSDIPPVGKKRYWDSELRQINHHLVATVRPLATELLMTRDRLIDQLHQKNILTSREFSFALYPEQYLCDMLNQMASSTIECQRDGQQDHAEHCLSETQIL